VEELLKKRKNGKKENDRRGEQEDEHSFSNKTGLSLANNKTTTSTMKSLTYALLSRILRFSVFPLFQRSMRFSESRGGTFKKAEKRKNGESKKKREMLILFFRKVGLSPANHKRSTSTTDFSFFCSAE